MFTARHVRAQHPRQSLAWACCGAFALLLGLALFFNVDLELTRIARAQLERSGWYSERRAIQEPLVAAVALLSVGATVVMLVAVRRAPITLRLALLASVGLATLAAIEGISFHDTDALLHMVIGDRGSGAALASVAAALLLIAALWERTARRDR